MLVACRKYTLEVLSLPKYDYTWAFKRLSVPEQHELAWEGVEAHIGTVRGLRCLALRRSCRTKPPRTQRTVREKEIAVRDIFVSKPSALTEHQQGFWQQMSTRLKERSLRLRTLGTTDYSNVAPIGAVKELMNQCRGAVILGFAQMRVIEGVSKEGTEKQEALTEKLLPTPWNHIEAGMAFALGLPVLVVKEAGVGGGVFDLGTSDRFIHEVTLPGGEKWLQSAAFLQPLNQWMEDVANRDAGR